MISQALRMGYHREPSNFNHISPFDGEMQRRNWALICQWDLLSSFQLGLPSSIKMGQCDTELPRNLKDSDFDENSCELPRARPDTEMTTMLYYIAKHRLLPTMEKILTQELSRSLCRHEEILETDAELRKSYRAIPQAIKYIPMSQSFVEAPSVILNRLKVELMYQKSLCILHRRYMASNVTSKVICQTAAMGILTELISIHQETQLGGRLNRERWMISSIHASDFYLAILIVCSIVSTRNPGGSQKSLDAQHYEMMVSLLRQAYEICGRQRSKSQEGSRVTDTLATILAKLENKPAEHEAGSYQPPAEAVFSTTAVHSENVCAFDDSFESLFSEHDVVDWVSPYLLLSYVTR